MSDDLIVRRVLQEQQGCESESGVLTINRCYFKHDFSAQIYTHAAYIYATAGTLLAFVLFAEKRRAGSKLYDHLYPLISRIA